MIITVCSYKGGVGKSTSAVHIAAYLAARGETVLLDGDPNRSVTEWAKPGGLPFTVADERESAMLFRSGKAEHVVIDTAARPSGTDLEVLARSCDLLIFPSTPDAMSLHALILTVGALQATGSTARYKVLLTVVPPRPNLDGVRARAALVEAEFPIFDASIRRSVLFPRAAELGCVVSAVRDPRAGDAWSDYEAVGKEIMS